MHFSCLCVYVCLCVSLCRCLCICLSISMCFLSLCLSRTHFKFRFYETMPADLVQRTRTFTEYDCDVWTLQVGSALFSINPPFSLSAELTSHYTASLYITLHSWPTLADLRPFSILIWRISSFPSFLTFHYGHAPTCQLTN